DVLRLPREQVDEGRTGRVGELVGRLGDPLGLLGGRGDARRHRLVVAPGQLGTGDVPSEVVGPGDQARATEAREDGDEEPGERRCGPAETATHGQQSMALWVRGAAG